MSAHTIYGRAAFIAIHLCNNTAKAVCFEAGSRFPSSGAPAEPDFRIRPGSCFSRASEAHGYRQAHDLSTTFRFEEGWSNPPLAGHELRIAWLCPADWRKRGAPV